MTPLRKRMTEDLQLKGYSPATQAAYLPAVTQLARHYQKGPELINEEELRAYFLHLTQTGRCARSTLRIAESGIKFCFTITLQKAWPVLGWMRPGKERKLPVILSPAEVRRILQCVRAPLYRVCLTTIYACGLRISEGIAVRVDDVDSQRMGLRVRGKGNKDRWVPLAPATLELLRGFWRLHGSRPWLFPAHRQPRSPGTEGPMAAGNLRQVFTHARQQSGVTKAASVHSLRHAYATHLLEAGVSLRVIQEILGHRSPNTTAIYTHLTAAVCDQVTAPLHALTQNL